MTLGEKILKLRKQRGLKQNDLSLMSGTTTAAISMIESGKRNPQMNTLSKIAQALGVKVEYFFNDSLPLEGHITANELIRAGSFLTKMGKQQKKAANV